MGLPYEERRGNKEDFECGHFGYIDDGQYSYHDESNSI